MAVPILVRMTNRYSPVIIANADADHEHVDPSDVEERDRELLLEEVDRRVRVDARAEEAARTCTGARTTRRSRQISGHQARGVPQRPVGDPLDERAQIGGRDHGCDRAP